MTTNMQHEACSLLLQQAEDHVRQRDYRGAQQLLMRAHGVRHAVKADHLKAHRALIRLGIYRRNAAQVLSQCALLVLAFLFD